MATDPAQIDSTGEATGQNIPQDIDHEEPDDEHTSNASDPDRTAGNDSEIKLSKNQLKKLKRKKDWENNREELRQKRKEHRRAKTLRRREIINHALMTGLISTPPHRTKPGSGVLVPVCLILDCGFDEYMRPEEIVSLSGQLVRCYADNRRSSYRTHMFYSSFGGRIKERFDVALNQQYKNWSGVHFVEGDYLVASRQADELMRGPGGGEPIGILRPPSTAHVRRRPSDADDDAESTLDSSQPEGNALDSIVYLTSDSPNTLTHLEPYTSYVVGGIVDRNREKGICYRRAMAGNVRTAKLPIGEYLALSTRHVLTTNHVVEIMLKWLECGDWGASFMKVIPSRKGARLRRLSD